MRHIGFLLGAALLIAPVSADETISIVGWNVESGGADGATVRDRIALFDGVDLWGLCEVAPAWPALFEQGAEDGEPGDFTTIVGTTGSPDLLLIIYDSTQIEELNHFEIDWDDRYWYKRTYRPRSALVAHFKLRDSGAEFMFMVNHLYRGSGVDPRRLDQAKKLHDWAAEQTIPVIAVGDYNFDYDLDPGQDGFNYQKGLGDMTGCGSFEWIRPTTMVTTHDSSYNSILDFVFLADPTGTVNATSEIIVASGDFPDDITTPDHRPVSATVTFGRAASSAEAWEYALRELPWYQNDPDAQAKSLAWLESVGNEGWIVPDLALSRYGAVVGLVPIAVYHPDAVQGFDWGRKVSLRRLKK